jgi:Family of unknown function (DUF5691)
MPDPNLWQSLVATALIGTERQADLPRVNGSPIGELIAQLPGGNAETSLLNRAAALALYCKAGQPPLTVSATGPIACEPDDVLVCPQPALVYLRQTLSGDRRAQLPECLRLIAEAGWRMPERLLPQVLELGRKQPELRPVIMPVLGKRGLWLATQLQDGNYAIATTDSGDWETGTRSQRLRYLAQMRLVDPALARSQLEGVFGQENAKDRALFLKTLQVGLSEADLVFLEGRVADRGQDVQQVAISLLTQLPTSSLCQQAIAAVQTAIVDRRPTQGRFDLAPPTEALHIPAFKSPPLYTGTTLGKAAGKTLGKAAVQLAQLISWVPLKIWPEQFGITVPELVKSAADSHWRDAVIVGLINASLNQRNGNAAAALIAGIAEEEQQLIDRLDPQQAHQLLHQLFENHQNDRAWWLLRNFSGPWNQTTTEIAIRLTTEKIKSNPDRWAMTQWLGETFANCVDLTSQAVIESLQSLETDDAYLQAQLVQLYQTIQFRQEMVQALRHESG